MEARAFSALAEALGQKGTVVLGLSADSVAAQARFKKKKDLTVRLLSDPDRTLLRALGALAEINLLGIKMARIVRSTYVFDEQGRLIHHYPRVKIKGHAQAVLDDLG